MTPLELHSMRRWLLVFLLIVMPFQMVWGAAATYCAHEKQAAVMHFGHHEHKHHGADQADKAGANVHADCGSCHLGNPASVPAALAVAVPPPAADPVEYRQPRYASRIPPGLERPQKWPDSNAVRFGSGVMADPLFS
jgi:hypothetical protein